MITEEMVDTVKEKLESLGFSHLADKVSKVLTENEPHAGMVSVTMKTYEPEKWLLLNINTSDLWEIKGDRWMRRD